MMLSLVALGVFALLELTIWLSFVWPYRKIMSIMVLVGLAITSVILSFNVPRIWIILLVSLNIYRAINLIRIVVARMHEQYLRRATRLTSWMLILWQAILLGIWQLTRIYEIHSEACWIILSAVQLALAVILLASILRHRRTTRMPEVKEQLTDSELPTLTVAIPARNETDMLEECLTELVSSNYPKLEIRVLDDCSQNKRTPEIIKSFAQSGVRFIAGEVATDDWLAKNLAYQKLFDNASGELILFCGVDVRFKPNSLRQLVGVLLQKNKSMISVMPDNDEPKPWRENESLMLQPVRYAWELGLPRRMFNRPPVLSSCWLIRHKVLASAGGFAGVSRSIVPESYFARVAAVHDGYSFLQSDETTEISSVKRSSEQFSTAVRTRYPQLHRRPELVSILAMIEFVGLVLPFGMFLTALVAGDHLSIVLFSGAACLLLIWFYAEVVRMTYRTFLVQSLFLFPLAVMFDILLLFYSMYKYEFSEVIWKGRNVCVPVMHVVPTLPKS
jgi:glycosyltransferase involved in cell wall biosynthesis